MKNAVRMLSLELNREIAEVVKELNSQLNTGTLSPQEEARVKADKKELNKERIKALGLVLIQGGKYE